MLTGFNTNVPLKGKVYHVQTEDNGEVSATVVTLLYHSGMIISRNTLNYADMLMVEDWQDKVQAKMKKQHIAMIKSLLTGEALKREGEPAAPTTD